MASVEQLITTIAKNGGSVDHAGAIIDQFDIWSSAIKAKSAAGRGTSKKLDLFGIKKLRELILELAVRGLIVQQDSNDETASELLKKIAIEKAKLVKDGKIKKLKKLQEIGDEEKFDNLPLGWEFVRLNDLGEWGAGATPRRGESELYGGNIPWFKSGELVGDFISESEETVTELALKKASLRYNKVGDVLLAMYGATIGKTSILTVPATTNQAVCACTPFSGFSNIYLLTLLKAYRPRFIGMGVGGAQPNISREKIINTVIALPPAEEQHRIVAKVDELMSLCDQLEQQTEASISAHQTLVQTLLETLTRTSEHDSFNQAWARIAKHFDTLFTTEWSIDQLKQTILQLSVMGKLVPQNPNDEPASELLRKIASEKYKLIKEGEIKKQKLLPPIEEGEKPFELPVGWEWCRLMDISSFENGDRSKRYPNSNDLVENGIPFFGAPDIVDGKLAFTTDLRFISEEKFEELSNGKLVDRDFIMLLRGTVGKTAQFHSNALHHTGFINAQMLIIRLLETAMDGYVNYFFKSNFFANSIAESKSGAVIQQIPASKISEMLFSLPPIEEQYRIAGKVDELMSICDTLKKCINTAQITQLHLADVMAEQLLN